VSCDGVDVYTIGFSNRTWDDTLAILHAYQIELVVDVRTLPGSRKFPHFNIEHLSSALPSAGIEYHHLPALGGLRKKSSMGNINAAWRNASFRNYADYMQTAEFKEGLDQLVELFRNKRTVYACTEAVYWRWHRSLISDALLVRSFVPGNILSKTKCVPHSITKFARVNGVDVTYPLLDAVDDTT
jgi:uncharacterized protein (DUF488 family)